jgi:hypothetical protein
MAEKHGVHQATIWRWMYWIRRPVVAAENLAKCLKCHLDSRWARLE